MRWMLLDTNLRDCNYSIIGIIEIENGCVVINMAVPVNQPHYMHRIARALLSSKGDLNLITQAVSQYDQLHLKYICSPTRGTVQSDDLEVSM